MRVLIVDDEQALARAIAKGLARLGAQAEVAFDGVSAREKLGRDNFDALVMDFRIAEDDGVEIYRSLPAGASRPPAVLYSAHLDVATTVRALKAGFEDVIEKPVSLAVLSRRLENLVPAEPRDDDRPRSEAERALLGHSPPIAALRDEIQRLGPYRDLAVLVIGETGTGKELVARGLHEASGGSGPFVAVNCAAVPDALFESELFGHEAGAYTGARGSQAGLLEQASGGTLFLDEVGEMPAPLQAKLLRVLETRSFRRVGGRQERTFDARVVSATNREVDDAGLRSDILYRLAGYVLRTPPLRRHPEDIGDLAAAFAERFSRRTGVARAQLSPAALDMLGRYDFPGNVRELRAIVENAIVTTGGGVIDAPTLKAVMHQRTASSTRAAVRVTALASEPTRELCAVASGRDASQASLPVLERQFVLDAFSRNDRNLSRAARALGIPRSTLRDRLRRYGVL